MRDRGGEANGSLSAVARLTLVAALGGFLFGYDSSVINGAVDAIGHHYDVGSTGLGFAVSSALLGAAAGAVIAGRVSDRFGRLKAMRVGAVLFLVSALGTGLADYVFATVAGGSEKTLWLGLAAWRWMFLAMSVPAVAYGVLSLTIPESPRYLIARGRVDDGKAVLKRILGGGDLDAKVEEIRRTLSTQRRPRLADVRGPALGLLPIVWVGIGLSVFQQFVGINVIFYYSSVLWQAVGFSEHSSLAITVITSVVNIATTFVAIALIDKIGRRPLLLMGSAGMTVTLAVMAVIFGTADVDAHGQPVLHGAAGPLALLAANAFVFFFGMSWGPVVWVMLGEKFPNRLRASALAVAASAQWLANWAITTTFPPLKDIGLGVAYGLYAAFALLSFVFVRVLITETRGAELEDMPEDIHAGTMHPGIPVFPGATPVSARARGAG